MKRSILFVFSALIIGVLLLSFKAVEKRNFIFTFLEEEPSLPSTLFDYQVDFPAHLTSDTLETGYEVGSLDSNSFKLITDAGATLGRVLFYDQKLSALENITCASCHNQQASFAENKIFSEGISSLTKRNSMNLNDIAWTSNQSFFWDMSHSDLHEMIVLPLKDENEIGAVMADVVTKLNSTSYYPDLFTQAYGSSVINEVRIVDALVQFVSSMNTFNSRFDQQAMVDFKDFTELENEGKNLFQENCTSCHTEGGINNAFTFEDPDNNLPIFEMMPFIFNNGLEPGTDLGAGEWSTSGFADHLFKIPTLRNIALTAPYMHDGSKETLEDVIRHYSQEVVPNAWTGLFIPSNGFKFSDRDQEALVKFMGTLTDTSFGENPIWSDPFKTSVDVTPPSIADDFFIMVSPNPMIDFALIEFNNPSEELVTLKVVSLDGKVMEQKNTHESIIKLNKNKYSSGIYFLEIQKGKQVQKQKLIVQ